MIDRLIQMWGEGVMILFFFKGQVHFQYFIIQVMGQSSMFLKTSALVRVGGGKGGIPERLHTCLLLSLLKNTTCS